MVTDDAQLADRLRSLKFHGLGVDAYDRHTHGRKPQAEVIMPGFKYNLPDINAAIALVQLQSCRPSMRRRYRRALFARAGRYAIAAAGAAGVAASACVASVYHSRGRNALRYQSRCADGAVENS